MSKEVSVAEILDMDDMVVSTQGYTRKQLSDAFDKLTDGMDNWKMPIETMIDGDDFEICREACEYFTGSELTAYAVDSKHNKLAVGAAGYYNTIGA